MKNRKYEQPKLELIAVAANDVLLASGGGTEDPTVVAGGLINTFTGARGEIDWSDILG